MTVKELTVQEICNIFFVSDKELFNCHFAKPKWNNTNYALCAYKYLTGEETNQPDNEYYLEKLRKVERRISEIREQTE